MSYIRLAFLLFSFSFIACIGSAQLTYNTLRIEYDSGWTYKNLTLIPIRFKPSSFPIFYFPAKVISLKEAMQHGKVKFKEFYYQNDASVRLLTVDNNSDNFVLIENGETISGGKQDRMIAESKILYPHQIEQYVDVFCIEQNRWDDKPKPFKYAGGADAELKRIMDETHQQQFIWREIESRYSLTGSVNKTAAYLQVPNINSNQDTAYTGFFNRKLQTSDSLFAGFIAITDTTVMGCEVFAATSLTLKAFDAMVHGWIGAVLLHGKTPDMPYKRLKIFTDDLFANEEKQKLFLQKHGKAFICEKKVFHIVVHGEERK